MQQQGTYRHEMKYPVSYADYLSIRQRLRPVMHLDPHVDSGGHYTIRSIYFDNAADKALREKINGESKREKFRIRYYNDDFSFITLEKKIKFNDLCMKFDAAITEEECRKILEADTEWMPGHSSELVREFYCKMRQQQIRPRVLVSYTREPYIYRAGNVRITFDSQIRTTLFHRTFLERQVHDISATEQPADMLMEVKYDAYLPDVIADLIQTGHLRQQAFSKYGACRRFG